MSNVRDFGAVGNGVADDTMTVEHALSAGNGTLEFPRGEYKLTRTIRVDLAKHGRFALSGSGGTARLIMAGAGPVLSLLGGHEGSALPASFKPETWDRERMPTVSDVEIVGAHPEADGIHISGVMQPTLAGVLIREVRTAVYINRRARNVLVSHCHIYKCSGIGIHLDRLNLHQTIITGSHISYCRLGGIRIEKSEIRNLQITGNDIEYNNNQAHKVPDADDVATAEIYIDASEGSIREGTIVSNTIQATYNKNGANIRLIGQGPDQPHKVGLWIISGNLIGSQENNIHLSSARGVTISGNVIYSGHNRNLLIENSRNIAIGANCFDHNPDYEPNELCTGIRIVDSVDCTLTGVLIQDAQAGRHTVKNAPAVQHEALLELVRCRRMTLSGLQVLEGAPYGISLEDCHDTLITGSTVLDAREPKLMRAAIRWSGTSTGSQIGQCRLGNGSATALEVDPSVKVVDNRLDGA